MGALATPAFVTAENVLNIVRAASVVGIAALGVAQGLVVASGANPIITTLGAGAALFGLAPVMTDQQQVNIDDNTALFIGTGGPLERALLPCDMGKFLAIFHGAADDESQNELSAEQQREFMRAWGAWAKANQDALADPGAPLFMKKMVTSGGVEDFTDTKVGYTIVEADSHDEAVRIFSGHPHLELLRGNSNEVLECPSVPVG